jgi:hypothetical protein
VQEVQSTANLNEAAIPAIGISPGHRWPSILLAIMSGAVALAMVASIGWRMSGGSLYMIATPSMCPDLCVGTLVFDRPLVGPVQDGMVVTFRPPGTTTVFTHRVVRLLADGSFKTAGDALGKVDPWTVPRGRVVAKVVFAVRTLGWIWRSLTPITAVLALYLLGRRSMRSWPRKQFDLLFVTLLVVIPVLAERPLVRASLISWHSTPGGPFVMQVANVGLLPVRYAVTGGAPTDRVAAAEIVTLHALPGPGGRVALRVSASMPGWQWAVAGLIVLLPMITFLAEALRARLVAPAGRGGTTPGVATLSPPTTVKRGGRATSAAVAVDPGRTDPRRRRPRSAPSPDDACTR